VAPRILLGVLLVAPAVIGQTASPQFAKPTVGLILTFQQQPAPAFARELRRSVDEVFRPAGLGFHWLTDLKVQPGTYDRAIVANLTGRCDPRRMDELPATSHGRLQLGTTVVNDGEVIPFINLHCDDMARVVSAQRAVTPNRLQLDAMFYRVAARVMAHELMHALLKTTDHRNTDCARAPLRAADLMMNAKLQPSEVAALREIGRAWHVKLAREGSPAAGQ